MTLLAALQLDVQPGERLHADHVVHDACCVGVVCAVVELINGACGVFKALVPACTHTAFGLTPSSQQQVRYYILFLSVSLQLLEQVIVFTQ